MGFRVQGSRFRVQGLKFRVQGVEFRGREFFLDNLLVRIHRCFWWTVLAPGFRVYEERIKCERGMLDHQTSTSYRGASPIRNSASLGPYIRNMPRAL